MSVELTGIGQALGDAGTPTVWPGSRGHPACSSAICRSPVKGKNPKNHFNKIRKPWPLSLISGIP